MLDFYAKKSSISFFLRPVKEKRRQKECDVVTGRHIERVNVISGARITAYGGFLYYYAVRYRVYNGKRQRRKRYYAALIFSIKVFKQFNSVNG